MSAQNETKKLPPKFDLEAPTTPEELRVSTEAGDRYHQRWLRNMYGAFLTVLNGKGEILHFAGGALRRKADDEYDEVTIMTPESILAGITGGYQPEYEVVQLRGDERREYKIVFRDVPFLSLNLGAQLPEACSWGILKVGPSPDKRWNGAIPNGENSEVHLDHRTWNEAQGMGKVPASGGNDIAARLAPSARETAEKMQSAWSLAITGAFLFGGMTENVPTVEPIRPSQVLNQMIDHETDMRRRKKQDMELKRARRMAERMGGGPRHDAGMSQLAAAINPAVLDEMDKKLQQDPAGDTGGETEQ